MFFIADLSASSEIAPPVVVVIASRAEQEVDRSAASVSVIDPVEVERLGEPLLSSLLRLTPSASLSTSGPAGTQTQLRLRGSEANHTLLFIDGIKANDVAADNEARFELLAADLADRVEVVRGPQSALWGSEAIGGVVAVSSTPRDGARAEVEAGSLGFVRLSGSAGTTSDDVDIVLGGGFQRSHGIDSLAGGNGDRDGDRNGTVRGRVAWRPSAGLELAANGFAIRSRSEFDGLDSVTFQRADTEDSARNRLTAGRLGARYETGGWVVSGGTSALRSSNRNLLDDEQLNQTRGGRTTVQVQVERQFSALGGEHRLIGALDGERETFKRRDDVSGTPIDNSRRHSAFTGEWRADWGALVTDLAVRRDGFNRFKDATSLRASGLFKVSETVAVAMSYGEGIAQPTFFDLFGFPGFSVGNPQLTPERSRGLEAGLRYNGRALRGSLTYYRQTLRDEIVSQFVPAVGFTAVNSDGKSPRSGLEVEGSWTASPALQLSLNYAYLRARQPTDTNAPSTREIRRPKHSGSVALTGEHGRLSYGASVALVGARDDEDFDFFPAPRMRLSSYALAGARLAYRIDPRIEIFGRIANAFDDKYQDVVGYRTEGRSAYAGIRLGLDR